MVTAEGIRCPACGEGLAPDVRVCPVDGTVLEYDAAEPTLVRDALIGTRLGEYVIEQRIGSGGMGIVYRGRQPIISKTVAIKILRPDLSSNATEVERILTEARTVNAIGHRGIIDIFGFGIVPDGRQYLVMEYLEGAPLDRVISERAPMPFNEVLPILDELLDALGAVHAAGVIHRDLKPSNIFLATQRTGAAYVKILDFGLAKHSSMPGGEVRQTRQSMVCGTPEFMAPEQARGMSVSPRTDLYALGCIAYEMLTGRLPFAEASAVETMMAHIEKPVTPPSHVMATVPPRLDDVLLPLLAKNAEERPANASIVRTELKRIRRELATGQTLFRVPQPLESLPPRRGLRPAGRGGAEAVAPTALAATPPANAGEVTNTERVSSVEHTIVSLDSVTAIQRDRRSRIAWAAVAAGAVFGIVLTGVVWSQATDGAAAATPPPVSAPAAVAVEEVEPAVTEAPVKAAQREPVPAAAKQEAQPTVAAETRRPPARPRRIEPGVITLDLRGWNWGDVFIDGEPRGRAPPKMEHTVAPGTHKVEIRQLGVLKARGTVHVRSGQRTKAKISLVK